MRTDAQIQQDVMAQLKWSPLLSASDIGVSVKDGVVTLSGHVDTYAKKLQAEKETKKVIGVKAIAEEIHVGLSPGSKKTDAEIAKAVLHSMRWNTTIPDELIKIKVEEGIVTLEGEVNWEYQRKSAENAVAKLTGVRSVLNSITIKQKVAPDDLKQRIKAAFQRNATLDASNIEVEVIGGLALLKGRVRSFAEKEDAEHAVWSAPGVVKVENKLKLIDEPAFSFT